MAVEPGQALDSRGDSFLERGDRVRRVFDRDRMQPPFGHDHGTAAEKSRNRRRIDRRGHDGDAQIPPRSALEPPQKRQRDIGIQMAFVKLIQNDDACARKLRVGQKPARQNALGQETDARSRTSNFFEPDLVSDHLAGPLSEFLRNPPRCHTRRYTARFEYQDVAIRVRQQCGWHAGRLARARRRL